MFASLLTSKWLYFGILGVALAGSAWLAFYEYGQAQSAAAKATAQCYAQISKSNTKELATLKATYTKEIASLKAQNKKYEKAVETLASQKIETEQKYIKTQEQLQKVLDTSPTASKWYHTTIPPTLQKILNQELCQEQPNLSSCR